MRPRRGYIDWLRGLAVVIMIEAHTLDSWTEMAWRGTLAFWYHQLIAGFAAPIFLFMAGVSVALAAGGKLRRGASVAEASKAMQWRGLQIWGLALLFRVQAWLLSPGATLYGILKVDILNIMGPAITAAALVWGLVTRRGDTTPTAAQTAWSIIGLSAAAALFGLLTPLIRHNEALGMLPDPIEWYIRPWPGRTTFTFFPWAGFVFAGAAIGVLIDRVRDRRDEGRLNLRLGLAGAGIAAAAFAASFLPTPYAQSSFWTSSPSFFFLRVGLMALCLALAYAWSLRPTADRYSPLQQFGRTSLFIYWIHVEMVYGILSYPLHRNLSMPVAIVAFGLFTTAMFGLSVWKTRLAERHRTVRQGAGEKSVGQTAHPTNSPLPLALQGDRGE